MRDENDFRSTYTKSQHELRRRYFYFCLIRVARRIRRGIAHRKRRIFFAALSIALSIHMLYICDFLFEYPVASVPSHLTIRHKCPFPLSSDAKIFLGGNSDDSEVEINLESARFDGHYAAIGDCERIAVISDEIIEDATFSGEPIGSLQKARLFKATGTNPFDPIVPGDYQRQRGYIVVFDMRQITFLGEPKYPYLSITLRLRTSNFLHRTSFTTRDARMAPLQVDNSLDHQSFDGHQTFLVIARDHASLRFNDVPTFQKTFSETSNSLASRLDIFTIKEALEFEAREKDFFVAFDPIMIGLFLTIAFL